MRDRRILYATAFVRALATGMIGVLLGFYLAELELGAGAVGAVVAAGLAGATAATLLVTLAGDRWGRRRTLIALSLLCAAGGVALAVLEHPLLLGLAAFLGMANGMGRDRGAALVLEQAVLPGTVSDERRTFAFASYNVAQDAGHALGALLAGAPAWLGAAQEAAALRGSLVLYALLSMLPVLLYPALSSAAESAPASRRLGGVSAETRSILWRISALFALDSFGGGFLTAALLSYFFRERFGVGVEAVGLLFFGARTANALSHLAAAWLARRLGLVPTMVFTHVPSSLLLVTVAFAPSYPVAAALFLLREGLVEMDVPTRQSYLMAVVRPEERTLASGVAHLVRLAGWAAAPTLAGLLMVGGSLGAPLLVGAGLKLAYDVMLYRSFRDVRPPEER